MFKEKTKVKPHRSRFVTILVMCLSILSFGVLLNCISPNAFKTEIQGIRAHMNGLEKVAEELSVWKKNVQAETINYGGAGWVVVGTGTIVLIFTVPGFLLIRAFMRRGNMLTLLAKSVKDAASDHPQGILAIKENLKYNVQDGHFCEQDRKNLGIFARKKGHFVEQKGEFEV